MDIGIVGLPRSGKTTIFNAVTGGSAPVGPYAGSQAKPNVGVAKVPDQRLDALDGIFNAKRKVPAEVTYVDMPAAPEGFGKTTGISGEFLNHLQRADALLLVARAFEDQAVPHVADSVDPFRDVETVSYELTFADMEILDRRLARLEDSFKGAKAPEREALNREKTLLGRLRGDLEEGIPLREQSRSRDEARVLDGFQLLTAKPLVVVANVGEGQLAEVPSLEARLASEMSEPRVLSGALCGMLEMELAQMEPEETVEFRESLGLGDSGSDRITALSHQALDLVTFFTGNANEVRAWTVARDMEAVKAAGKVHSDLERGFIRAEVVGFDDLAQCGSVSEARRRGLLRQEGRSYPVKEGDVINILFNV